MKTICTKRQVMRNAWYLKRVSPLSFSACLRRAWRNERLAQLAARLEGRPAAISTPGPVHTTPAPAFSAGCLAWYAEGNHYYGD